MGKLIDAMERLVFGATAQERVDMMAELAARRVVARLTAALDDAPEDAPEATPEATPDGETIRRAIAILDAMCASGELSALACERLRWAMRRGEDAYPYYSVTGRPFVWSEGQRFTAQDYTVQCMRRADRGASAGE